MESEPPSLKSSQTLVQDVSAEPPDEGDSGSESSYCEYDDPDYEYTQPEEILERHDDHWDEIIEYHSPWKNWTQPGESWFDTRVSRPEESRSNDQLYADPPTQNWLSKLSGLQRSGLRSLRASCIDGYAGRQIPLFKDESTGDEYQVNLHLRQLLVKVWCPAVSNTETAQMLRDYPIFQLRYRIPPASDDRQSPTVPLPKFVIPLGTLSIRTTSRYPLLYGGKDAITEGTDYTLVMDAERDEMPVWLMCSRRQLQERVEEEGWNIPQLPIFGGGMQNEDFGYDAACIFDSVRQMGSHSSFQAACELVSQTRAVVDPGVLMGLDLSTKMEEIEAELSVSGTVKAVSSAEEAGASPVQHLPDAESASPGADSRESPEVNTEEIEAEVSVSYPADPSRARPSWYHQGCVIF